MRQSRATQPRPPRALWLRGRWPDHNPLRRTSDRVEAAIIAIALILFLAGAPLLALFAWHWADSAAHRVQQRQQATWHQVSALLLADARPVVDIGYGGIAGSEVPARWTAPDGTARAGDVPAPENAQAGRTVRIWVDESGAQTGPPLRAQQATGQATLAAVLAPFALGTVLLCAVSVAVYILDRRRLAAWAADWRSAGPRWNSHR
jgi:sensor c-di-GMP phosphodiesterase-like protein